MQVYTRFKVMPRSHRTRQGFYWALAMAALGLLIWLWWKGSIGAGPGEGSQTNRPAARTAPVPVASLASNQAATVPGQRVARPLPSAVGSEAAPMLGHDILDTLAMQLALVRLGISPGPLDGRFGPQTRAALRAFQGQARLPPTGLMDGLMRERLPRPRSLFRRYTVTAGDLARLEPVSASWWGKSQQMRLEYESLIELVAESSQGHPRLIQRLNPAIDWTRVPPGAILWVPDAAFPPVRTKAAFVRIRLGERTLVAFDSRTNLLAHFPCSIARRVEKRPVGKLRVIKIAPHPTYRFDPALFPDSREARDIHQVLVIPPGPNNPVGNAWIGLDKPGYGIHGTPRPEEVGRTESLGCFRLANWNAEYLLELVWIEMPVYVEP